MNEGAMRGFLRDAIKKHGVPGAALALLEDGVTTVAAAGVLNLDTRVPVTQDAMFQIGSITKVFTATLLMKLVDAGTLDLDLPIVRYLPDFALADAADARRVTTRHLLTHTSGIDGDFVEDTGRGEQAIEEYVRRCRTLMTIHPVGQAFSYCNTGYVIAGRLVEVLAGQRWDQAMRTWLFNPLGMRHAATLPEDLVGKAAAIGHAPTAKDQRCLEPLASAYPIPFSLASAGATPTMSASDLLRFARIHLGAASSQQGMPVLSTQSVRAMQDPSVPVPAGAIAHVDHWGLGWSMGHWNDHAFIGHDGNTDGQRAFLRALPETGIAMALLTNGGAGIDLAHDAINEVLAVTARLPAWSEPLATAVAGADLQRYTGTYRHGAGHSKVFEQGRRLMMLRYERPEVEPQAIKLDQVSDDLFSCRLPPDVTPRFVKFLDPDKEGRPGCLFHLYRRCPRA